MMLNKRSSSRLDRKREDKEREFMQKVEAERQREAQAKAEEAKKAEIAKENKLRGREIRAKKRCEKEVWIQRETALLANRKREREVVTSEQEEVEPKQTKRRNPAMREWERIHSSLEIDESDGHSRKLRF